MKTTPETSASQQASNAATRAPAPAASEPLPACSPAASAKLRAALSGAGARLDQRVAAEPGREEDDRRGALALGAGLGRPRAERDAAAVDELRLDRDRAVLVVTDVLGVDRRRRIEERAHRT